MRAGALNIPQPCHELFVIVYMHFSGGHKGGWSRTLPAGNQVISCAGALHIVAKASLTTIRRLARLIWHFGLLDSY